MIHTVYFSPEFLFARELVIFRKCDEFVLQKEIKDLLSFCYIKSSACVLEVCDFFHKSSVFFTSRRQMKEPVLRRSTIVISS